jgi:hypothetical protein
VLCASPIVASIARLVQWVVKPGGALSADQLPDHRLGDRRFARLALFVVQQAVDPASMKRRCQCHTSKRRRRA